MTNDIIHTPFNDPDAVERALLRVEWAAQTQAGRVIAYVCPMCCSLIPTGSLLGGKSLKAHHTDFHTDIARRFQALGVPHEG